VDKSDYELQGFFGILAIPRKMMLITYFCSLFQKPNQQQKHFQQ
jgi:hypothetical protein